MRKIILIVFCLIAACAMLVCNFPLIVSPTFAGLVDRGGGLIYDDDLNITSFQQHLI